MADEPSITDCEAALAEVYTYLDGAVTIETRTAIIAHLQSCGSCDEAYDFEAELRTVIAARGGADECPDDLRIRIIERIEWLRLGGDPDDGGRPSAGA